MSSATLRSSPTEILNLNVSKVKKFCHIASLTLVFLGTTMHPTVDARESVSLPEFQVEAPSHLQDLAARIYQFDPKKLLFAVQLTGARTLERQIRIVLLTERSRVARDTVPWVAAFADPTHDLIVVFPERIGSYPFNSLEVVINHEVTHILTARAANGNHVPRWFNEGISIAAERGWTLDSRSRFIWESMIDGRVSTTELERMFFSGQKDSARAYVLSHAFVRNLMQRYGPDLISRILSRVANGETFDRAFINTTGTTTDGAINAFWRSGSGWEEWLTFVASPFTLWTMMTMLSLVAIWRHRKKRILRRRQWEEEERLEAQEVWKTHRNRNYLT